MSSEKLTPGPHTVTPEMLNRELRDAGGAVVDAPGFRIDVFSATERPGLLPHQAEHQQQPEMVPAPLKRELDKPHEVLKERLKREAEQ